jgi:hypothetical protein
MVKFLKLWWSAPEKWELLVMLIESIPILLPSILRGEEVHLEIGYDEKGGDKK